MVTLLIIYKIKIEGLGLETVQALFCFFYLFIFGKEKNNGSERSNRKDLRNRDDYYY